MRLVFINPLLGGWVIVKRLFLVFDILLLVVSEVLTTTFRKSIDHLQCQVLTYFQVVETLVITTKSTALLRTVSCHKKNSWINSICLVRHPL